jgi:hypothetical protein
LADISGYAIKEIGAYLDNGTIDTAKIITLPQIAYIPQLVNTTGVLSDTGNWVKIEGSFIANGTEQFITIGNFENKAHTTYSAMPVTQLNNSSKYSLYWIDDISVIETANVADAGTDTHVGNGDSVFIGRTDVAMDCSWTILGSSTIVGTGAGIWVKPTATTSYVVTQTLCGNVTRDTVKVEVWPAGIKSIKGRLQDYSITPNPSSGMITLHQTVAEGLPVFVKVFEATGKLVCSAQALFQDKVATLNLSDMTAGFYYVHLQDGYGNTYSMRLVRQ